MSPSFTSRSSVPWLFFLCACQSGTAATRTDCDAWVCGMTNYRPPGYLDLPADYDGATCPTGGAPNIQCWPPDPRASCNSWPCSPGDACENLSLGADGAFGQMSSCTPVVEAAAEACGEIFCQNGCSCADAGANHCACTAP